MLFYIVTTFIINIALTCKFCFLDIDYINICNDHINSFNFNLINISCRHPNRWCEVFKVKKVQESGKLEGIWNWRIWADPEHNEEIMKFQGKWSHLITSWKKINEKYVFNCHKKLRKLLIQSLAIYKGNYQAAYFCYILGWILCWILFLDNISGYIELI